MTQQTDSKEALLKRMREDFRRDQANAPRESHIVHEKKYSDPVGMDDNGDFFPEESKDWWKLEK